MKPHWLIEDAKTLPLWNGVYQPLRHTIDEMFIGALRGLVSSGVAKEKDYVRLIEVHEQARTIVEARLSMAEMQATI